jgi:GNAT superfamily N-acetyltransferase
MKTYDESGQVVSELDEINDDFIHNKYGYCYFEIEPGKKPIIFNLYIHPQYRKQGHAKKLLQYVINEIRQTGYTGEINIEAAPRQESIDFHNLAVFYLSMGLTVTNLQEAPNA